MDIYVKSREEADYLKSLGFIEVNYYYDSLTGGGTYIMNKPKTKTKRDKKIMPLPDEYTGLERGTLYHYTIRGELVPVASVEGAITPLKKGEKKNKC